MSYWCHAMYLLATCVVHSSSFLPRPPDIQPFFYSSTSMRVQGELVCTVEEMELSGRQCFGDPSLSLSWQRGEFTARTDWKASAFLTNLWRYLHKYIVSLHQSKKREREMKGGGGGGEEGGRKKKGGICRSACVCHHEHLPTTSLRTGCSIW